MKKFAFIAVSTLALAACAGSNQLANKTAFALGEESGSVSVTNIQKGLYEITWQANAPSGKYNCSAVGGNMFSFGQAVSPSCVKVGGQSDGKGTKKGFCNAMLKAAGRCN